jgi:hypothetical protein
MPELAPEPTPTEPLRTTLLRTGTIALVVGAVISLRAGLARWPLATLVALWPSFGGHWVELGFLRFVRPRLPAARLAQVVARLVVWFVAGVLFALAMALTATALGVPRSLPVAAWPVAGLAFIGIELVAHLGLRLLGRPSVYDGRG